MSSDEQDPLQSLFAEILEAENRGESVNRDALIDEHPDMRPKPGFPGNLRWGSIFNGAFFIDPQEELVCIAIGATLSN